MEAEGEHPHDHDHNSGSPLVEIDGRASVPPVRGETRNMEREEQEQLEAEEEDRIKEEEGEVERAPSPVHAHEYDHHVLEEEKEPEEPEEPKLMEAEAEVDLQELEETEPRITHTGSKYLTETIDYEVPPAMTGAELEGLQSIFKLFDYENNNAIRTSDIGELLRCLNFNPSEAEVKEFLKEGGMDGDIVEFDTLTPKVLELMDSGKFPPAAEEELLAAFCTLDPQLTGKLTVKQLKEALTMYGEPLTDEEFEDLIKFAPIDPKSGMVNYKEYAKELCAVK